MLETVENLINPQSIATLLAAVAAIATVLTVAMPLVYVDPLARRMRAVAFEREKLRQQERERLAQQKQKATLRTSPKQFVQVLVERLNLAKWLGQEEARQKLSQAGYRGQAPYMTFLVMRMVAPLAFSALAAFYLFFLLDLKHPPIVKLGACIVVAWLGLQLPMLLLKNQVQRRQLSINRAFPEALDLLLICVESGMSIEAAFRKVSEEVGTQSVPLAEELMLTTAELSYLPNRRQAYDNLVKRTDLQGVKSVCMALQQAERYGTPLGAMLRTMAQENRDMRMAEAEKKAAGLPPKLTVPMILFFLPVLFVVILGPAIIQIIAIQK